MQATSKKYLEIDLALTLSASQEVKAELLKDTTIVYLVSGFGGPRQGKSFLMDALCNDPQSFKYQPGRMLCTTGVDLSNVVKSLAEFAGDQSFDAAGTVRLIDTEATGDDNVDYNPTLNCAVMLVTAVVVFSWSGELDTDGKPDIIFVFSLSAFH